jgi:hypothetical protein
MSSSVDQTEINIQLYKSVGEASFPQLALLLSPDRSPTNCHTPVAVQLLLAQFQLSGQPDAMGQSRVIWRSHGQFDLANCPVHAMS